MVVTVALVELLLIFKLDFGIPLLAPAAGFVAVLTVSVIKASVHLLPVLVVVALTMVLVVGPDAFLLVGGIAEASGVNAAPRMNDMLASLVVTALGVVRFGTRMRTIRFAGTATNLEFVQFYWRFGSVRWSSSCL
jgi:hypothetical protein